MISDLPKPTTSLQDVADHIAITRLAAQRGLRELKRGKIDNIENVLNKVLNQMDKIVSILERR